MIALLVAAALQTSEPPKWQAIQQENIQAAELAYDVGVSLTAICRDKGFMLAITGLPAPAEGASFRKLEMNVPADDLQISTWSLRGPVALSTAPAVYALRLRATDHLTIRLPAESGQPPRRYELPLPSEHQSLDLTLEACGVPLEAESDITYDPTVSAVTWLVTPRIPPPDRLPRGGHADVLVECTVGANARPEDCRVIEEQPANSGFTRSVLSGVRSGRLGLIDGGPPPPGGVFRTRITINVSN